MSTTELTPTLSALERRLVDLPLATQDLADRLVALRRAVRAAKWNKVLEVSLEAVGAGHAHALTLADFEAESASTTRWLVDRSQLLSTAFHTLAGDDRTEIVANLRAQLTAVDPALADRLDNTLDRIKAGKPAFRTLSNSDADNTAPPTRTVSDLAIAASSRGLRGLVYHAFNTASSRPINLGKAMAVLDSFDHLVDDRESLLRNAQIRLYEAVKAGRARVDLANEARQLATTVEQFVLGFAVAQARVVGLASALREAGRGGDAENTGARLAAAGLLTREAFSSHAAALALVSELRRFRPSAFAQPVLEAASGVEFDRALPSGKRIELKQVPNTPDDTLVQIRGFATDFKQRRSADGKLVSTVTLLDPSSGVSATAVGLFVHLPHAGVTEGAFVHVHGFARASSPLLNGAAGVQIDVLPLVELAKRSWRLRLLNLGARWAETWRSGAHLYWSLGAHSAADDDSPAANRGAAELVFTPFARERN